MKFKEELKKEYEKQSLIVTEKYRDILREAVKSRKIDVTLDIDNLEDMCSVLHILSHEGFHLEWDYNFEVTGDFRVKVYTV